MREAVADQQHPGDPADDWFSAERELIVDGPSEAVIDMPMDVLLGKPPKMHRDVKRVAREVQGFLTGATS